MAKDDDLVLRVKGDLTALGPYIRRRRKAVGLSLSTDAAPWLGVGARTLLELESGSRGKRGITLVKLLGVLEGLGLELVVRARHSVAANPPRQ